MNIAHSIPSTVTGVSFSFLTAQDIRRISVKQIVNPVLLDDLNRPNIGGLYDPALGPHDRSDICATCHLTYFTCPGHFGHIELPAPVFHPLFMGNLYNLLRGMCMFCHRFKMSRTQLSKYMAKLRLLEHGLVEAAMGVDDITLQVRKTKKGKEKADEEEDVDMLGKEDVTYESDEQFVKRVHLYVAIHLARNKTTRDDYKSEVAYQMRKDLIHEFLRNCMMKKCQNSDCSSVAYTFRKEGYTKIIEYDLTPKQKATLARSRPNVLLAEKATSYTKKAGKQEEDVDMDGSGSSESEGAGDSLVDDEEEDDSEDESHFRKPGQPSLPRAANGKVKTSRGRNERVIAPEECRAHLRRLFKNETIMCSLIFGRHGPHAPVNKDQLAIASADMFFLEVLPVSPTRFRPPAKMGETLFEHPQNELLARVLNTSYKLRDINLDLRTASQKGDEFDEVARRTLMSQLLDRLIQLQIDVNSFMDSSKNPQVVRQGKLPPAGVKQGLEKKEGLFRKHMMGKRVNYAARSVISPDVNIEPSEIGIPPVFARKLTFPEPVTADNFHEMRQRVINGPNNYPGASMVEYEDGRQQSLDKLTVEQRTAIANQLLTPQSDHATSRKGLFTRTAGVNKKVYRHLQDGDILILNRQPTLHKPSMMCHRAKVLHGEKTIRMHYANCNSYNADFDGDENHVARAEATFIANTDNQYLVPTSGNPLRGLIQDHVVAGVWMTSQNAFFTREEYFQLLYGALRPEDSESNSRLVTLSPAIWKPQPLWTGKQIISTVLKNITPRNFEGLNLKAKTKVPGFLWGKDSKEDQVIFLDGELLCGVLDKSAFGASDYGLVHSVYEVYGAEIAGKLLGILSRLFTKFLQHRAFTCRMDDLILTPTGDKKRADLIERGKNLGTEGAIENFPSLSGVPKEEVPEQLRNLLETVLRDDNKMAGLDVTVKTKLSKLTSSISDACLPNELLRKFPYNHMQTMTLSGAKGSAVNARQISCALGQQELEGRRVPVMVSGKTLPSFKAFETKAIAGGYVASRFLTGIKPQEFYFHCMAGREGLIDTAVKTSRSGYLQRCLIKHLEGLRVHYDNTVRGSDNSVYQFSYGGDGLDVTKQKHLYQFAFIAQNSLSIARRLNPNAVANHMDLKTAPSYMKKVLRKSAERESPCGKAPRDEYDPVLSVYNPNKYLGSTSEQFATAVRQYIKANPDGLLIEKSEKPRFPTRYPPMLSKNFQLLMNVKYMRSLVEPGEAVGLLASQGVGEPSTQMTLNTFHFAGHGAANVTLGIPRLREIVMTASQKPKTPSMTMKVKPGTSPDDVTLFCKRASRVTLSQLVEGVTVDEQLCVEGQARRTQFTVTINFFPREEYLAEHDVEPVEILSVFGTKFPLILKREIQNELRKLDADLKSQIAQLGKGKAVRTHGEGEGDGGEGDGETSKRKRNADEDSEVGDGDADDEKRQRQKKQQATYDSDEDSDEEDNGEAFNDEDIEAAYASDAEAMNTEVKPAKLTKSQQSFKQAVSRTSDLFQGHLQQAVSFNFDESKCTFQVEFRPDMPKLLFVGIIERTCRATVVREIPGITDCFQVKEDSKKGGEPQIKLTTNGSNLRGMWEFASGSDESILEDDEIYSNDIYALLKTYGVEMARAAILKEVGGVFAAYSIQVDRRHLELIADYMTFDGGYKPFNRKGLSTNPSPLLKASYETTAAFLSDATLYGDFDDLTTPSGNIVLGRPNATGTGVFDVLMQTA
ncbi:RNA polymerase I largest subunit [Coprinopsis cinerea okayama7|uniref:DNA-directed RNA polymerase subunit n=1 Tax=Coprinopsis cinerea (strain Okayama-7 / 130 / ATCC MYA-4618 / FGSC 9003) TaxID=240176 RepID=D6RMH4_COPC7|nr:RNA polymerase I largest subunit [Coprinopsis cinerea okayama7\|eukprot:XP_002911169.1 RNA polymerase I largest subunit [Coprinopsis cinerea okayama7\